MCWHKWSGWTNPIKVSFMRDSGHFGDVCESERFEQFRKCLECNQTESRVITTGVPVRQKEE